MSKPPTFYSFRNWTEAKDEKEDRIRHLMNNGEYILFFRKGNDVFGAPEASRMIFANMKNPEKDGWGEGAHFVASNLIRALSGDTKQDVFNNEDLKKIKVIDQDEAENTLMKSAGCRPNPLGQGIMKLIVRAMGKNDTTV